VHLFQELFCCLETAAFAQDYAKVEVPLNYSYMRFNPENSHIISGLSLNGGGRWGWQFTLIIGLESKRTFPGLCQF